MDSVSDFTAWDGAPSSTGRVESSRLHEIALEIVFDPPDESKRVAPMSSAFAVQRAIALRQRDFHFACVFHKL